MSVGPLDKHEAKFYEKHPTIEPLPSVKTKTLPQKENPLIRNPKLLLTQFRINVKIGKRKGTSVRIIC